jgi:transposase-like protein
MKYQFSDSIEDVDWRELVHLYEQAPLGTKDPSRLKTAFDNSMFRCFVRDGQRIIGVGLKWTPNMGQVFKWDTVQRNGLPMTETKKRRLHPPELKAKLGLEALGGMKTINQIAQEHDVHPMQVRQWKRDIQDQAKSLFEGKRGPQPVSAASSPDRLYGEIGRLKMELDWLKKKSGISLP